MSFSTIRFYIILKPQGKIDAVEIVSVPYVFTSFSNIRNHLTDKNLFQYHTFLHMSGTPREVFARGDELMTAGLDVPQVTRVAMALRDKGIAINPAVYTVDELSKELVALKRGGGKKC